MLRHQNLVSLIHLILHLPCHHPPFQVQTDKDASGGVHFKNKTYSFTWLGQFYDGSLKFITKLLEQIICKLQIVLMVLIPCTCSAKKWKMLLFPTLRSWHGVKARRLIPIFCSRCFCSFCLAPGVIILNICSDYKHIYIAVICAKPGHMVDHGQEVCCIKSPGHISSVHRSQVRTYRQEEMTYPSRSWIEGF